MRRLPLSGALFGTEINNKGRTELIVLITPHIVDTLEEGARITGEVEDRIELQELYRPRQERGAMAELGATGPPGRPTTSAPAPPSSVE